MSESIGQSSTRVLLLDFSLFAFFDLGVSEILGVLEILAAVKVIFLIIFVVLLITIERVQLTPIGV